MKDQLRPYNGLGQFEQFYTLLQKHNNPAQKYGLILFAGDNGISYEHTTIYPPMQSGAIVKEHLEGRSPTSRLLERIGREELIIDVGLCDDIKSKKVLERKIRKGTVNFLIDNALSYTEVIGAIEIGKLIWEENLLSNLDIIGVGEIGSGNTLCAAALACMATGLDPRVLVGRGSADNKVIDRKIDIIHRAIHQHCPNQNNIIDMLSRFGGLEIAALTGFISQAAEFKTTIMLDGYVTAVAALLASMLDSRISDYLIAPGLSDNTGHALVLKKLGLEAIFNLDINYGEGFLSTLGMFFAELTVSFFS